MQAPAQANLLAAPFSDGHKPPNLAAGRAFYQVTAQRSAFAFAATGPQAGVLPVFGEILDARATLGRES